MPKYFLNSSKRSYVLSACQIPERKSKGAAILFEEDEKG